MFSLKAILLLTTGLHAPINRLHSYTFFFFFFDDKVSLKMSHTDSNPTVLQRLIISSLYSSAPHSHWCVLSVKPGRCTADCYCSGLLCCCVDCWRLFGSSDEERRLNERAPGPCHKNTDFHLVIFPFGLECTETCQPTTSVNHKFASAVCKCVVYTVTTTVFDFWPWVWPDCPFVRYKYSPLLLLTKLTLTLCLFLSPSVTRSEVLPVPSCCSSAINL